MVVQREISRDQNGWTINVPRVACHQYFDLYNSMNHIRPRNIRAILHELLAELQIAIENRAAVNGWYETLPETDERVARSPRHVHFLRVLTSLRHFIQLSLNTDRPRLILLG
jgi:hypothetical protein